jgi:hypothetical protein
MGFEIIPPPIECRIGLMIAVNAAAPTKKTSKPTNTQLMPPIRRRFLGANAAESVPARLPPNGWPALPKLVPRRNPQLRQKRNSDGIVEWQFEQTITVGPDEACGISEFSDIGDSPFAGLSKNIRYFYTANKRSRLQPALGRSMARRVLAFGASTKVCFDVTVQGGQQCGDN